MDVQQSERRRQLKTLHGRIKAARKARALSVVDAADRIGVSRVQFHQWENGTVKDFSAMRLLAFTKLVDVSLEWLLERRGPDPDLKPPEK